MKVLLNGADPDDAKYWVILLHGRGAGADDILALSMEFESHPGVSWLAPQAPNYSWYPDRFHQPRRVNEPYLTVSLDTVWQLAEKFPSERVILGGFSQGACLVSDLLTRRPKRYGGAWIFSGGFIGSDDEAPSVEGDLAGTPVVMCGSQSDPHIPFPRMKQTEAELIRLGARVETLFYPGGSHTVTQGEVGLAAAVLANLTSSGQPGQ